MKHIDLPKEQLSNFNVILGALYGQNFSEHPRILDELRVEFDLVEEIFGRSMTAKTPMGNLPGRSVGDTWSCLLPNYEIESKTQPILPMFRGDSEPTIYILTMTNKPIKGLTVDVSIKHSSSGVTFSLASHDDPTDARIVSMFHYIHPRLRLDLTRHRLKLVQMSGIEDFYTLFLRSAQIAAEVMAHTGVKEYHEQSNARWPVPKEEYSWESVWFQQMWALYKRGGSVNYPMYQYLDPKGAGIGAIYNNLEILRTGDRSRVHQLPLPVTDISVSDINLWNVDKGFEEQVSNQVGLLQKLKSRFWPEGLAENWPEETIRPASIHPNYACLEIGESFKHIGRGGFKSGY